ncbi:MAG: glycoside hydrolase family 127 protein [Candidatus Hinthialibacter antarcticus]|nr:glycoside hydrolase family 127 protein [Candidatus Hinthialibacter antarcticus]
MKRQTRFVCMIAILTVSALIAESAEFRVQKNFTIRAQPFSVENVQLLDGPFLHARDLDAAYLLRLEPDRLLAGFRENAGLPARAKKYGGWESMGVAGHTLGHFLTAASRLYAAGDERFLERINYIVDELNACQSESGFLAAFPEGKQVFEEVAKGDVRSAGFDLNGSWVPWYTFHKQFAGLIDAYRYCDNQTALEVAKKMGDWSIDVTSGLNDEQFQKMLACEHGGMNESMLELYAVTGDERYLELSKRFHHQAVLGPLAGGEAKLPGLHSNTQIPKIIGVAHRYEYTLDQSDRDIAEFFWDRVVHHHTYANGGNSNHEHFGPADQLAHRLSASSSESCNTYNMLKLTRHLFSWTADAGYADYYEQALYNHILAAQNPDDGMMCYFIPMQVGGAKTYSTPFESFWCCVGSGIENPARYTEGIYFHGKDELFVNLFIPSVLNWEEQGVELRQETTFPEAEQTTFKITKTNEKPWTLRVRVPRWCESGYKVEVNGRPTSYESSLEGYASITRTWKVGDEVVVTIPMSLHTLPTPDVDTRVALFYGPLLLAGDLGPDSGPEPGLTPVIAAQGRSINEWVKKVSGKTLTFQTNGAGRPDDLTLVPFYKMHHRRYGVYWDLFTDDEWQAHEADYRAEQDRLRELEARTVDVMRIGEMQPERNHNLQSEHSSAGEAFGRKWRHADNGGWFSFEFKTANEPCELVCTYWGDDAGNRTFDILIDGTKIAEQTLARNKPDEFFDVAYPVPDELRKEKEKITVKFQAHPGNFAGGLFGCRLVKTK